MAHAPTNLTTVSLSPEQGEAAAASAAAATAIAVPRLVRARTLLDAADIERVERLARADGGPAAAAGSPASPLLVFSRMGEKLVASLDGSIPSDAVVERLADGQVHTLAKVVGG